MSWFHLDNFWPIRLNKLHNPDTLQYRIELVIGWRSFALTGFWFGKR